MTVSKGTFIMRIMPIALTALLAAVFLCGLPCRAADSPSAATTKATLTYTPAKGADLTSTRVGALIRAGGADKQPLLSIIAPDHTGTTITDEPQLYWYISEATELPVEIALIEESSDE